MLCPAKILFCPAFFLSEVGMYDIISVEFLFIGDGWCMSVLPSRRFLKICLTDFYQT